MSSIVSRENDPKTQYFYSRKEKSLGLLCTKYSLYPYLSVPKSRSDSLMMIFVQLFELVQPGGCRIDRARRCCKQIRSGLTLIFFYAVSWFRLFAMNRIELAGVERRRIYDIVNILESVGVRVLFSLYPFLFGLFYWRFELCFLFIRF